MSADEPAEGADGADLPPGGGAWPACRCPQHREAETLSERVAEANARSRGERL